MGLCSHPHRRQVVLLDVGESDDVGRQRHYQVGGLVGQALVGEETPEQWN